MKTSIDFIGRIVIASAISLTLSAPLMAQQEVSPDRFETNVQSVQHTGGQNADQRAGLKRANKHTAAKAGDLRRSPKQTAYLKNASVEQIARK